jgi:hypothetical protein
MSNPSLPDSTGFRAKRKEQTSPWRSGRTVIDKVAMECGGKRSATPLWLRMALLLHQRITAVRESGVALRLPPHSTCVAPGRRGDFVNHPDQAGASGHYPPERRI